LKVGDLVKYKTRKKAYRLEEEWGEYVGVVTKIRYPCEEEPRLNDHQTHAVLWTDVADIYWENPTELELINEEN